MVTFDAAQAGTSAATWSADPRLRDRRPLPLDRVDELLVVAAHPDDETLGAGGLIAECVRLGIPASIVIVTDGGASGEPGIVGLRAAEAQTAARVLGARLTLLGLPDGGVLERRDAVRAGLEPFVAAASEHALVVAPWRGDGHRDHRVVGEVVAQLVDERLNAPRFVEYPIWLWHWGSPAGDDVPWDDLFGVHIPADRKARALAEYRSQTAAPDPMLRSDFLAHFTGQTEYFIEERPTLGGDYFDDLYGRRDDPWGFATRWYEERKRALTLAILPDAHYGTVFEIGCSIGVLTEGLVARSTELLAVDVSQAAVDLARQRLGPLARIERMDVADTTPIGPFDLIVLSEVGYYFDRQTLSDVLERIAATLAPGGTLVACHWRHHVADYPLDGDTVHEVIRELGLDRVAMHFEKDFVLEAFSSDGRSVAERTGLA